MSEIPQKPYYKIGEVCQYTDTQPYVLRFWESEFPQLTPQKGRTGQPVYTRHDIELILKIKHLLYTEEHTLAGAREQLGGRTVPPPPARSPRPAPRPRRVAVPAASEPEVDIPARADVEDDAAPEASAAEPDLQRARQELQTLRRRVAELDERWRRAEQALQESEEARTAEREQRERVAQQLETLVHEIEALQPPREA